MKGPKPTPASIRLFRHVVKTDSCWLWIGAKDSKGYGRMTVDRKSAGCHRVSYEIHNGEIPRGLSVCHRCDVPACIRPDHLFVGTMAENMADMTEKGRSTRGSKNPSAILNEAAVASLRADVRPGMSGYEASRKYGIQRGTVYQIMNGETWKHVKEAA